MEEGRHSTEMGRKSGGANRGTSGDASGATIEKLPGRNLILQEARTISEGMEDTMKELNRITMDPAVMGGKPCIRGMRVTVGTIVGLMATGKAIEEVLAAYPYIEREDILQALTYAAWRSEEKDLPLVS